jgi:hypothetical protein
MRRNDFDAEGHDTSVVANAMAMAHAMARDAILKNISIFGRHDVGAVKAAVDANAAAAKSAGRHGKRERLLVTPW